MHWEQNLPSCVNNNRNILSFSVHVEQTPVLLPSQRTYYPNILLSYNFVGTKPGKEWCYCSVISVSFAKVCLLNFPLSMKELARTHIKVNKMLEMHLKYKDISSERRETDALLGDNYP